MKVILLKELRGKGGEGDIIDVAPGFANNFLLTEGYAIKATPGNIKQLEAKRKNIAKREETRIADAQALKAQLDAARIPVEAQIGDEGQLFGSVTSTMVADAINATLGIEVDKRRVELNKPIKTAGVHEVVVSIYRDIKGTVTVVIGDDPETAEAEEAVEEAIADAETPAEEVVDVEVVED